MTVVISFSLNGSKYPQQLKYCLFNNCSFEFLVKISSDILPNTVLIIKYIRRRVTKKLTHKPE